MKVWPGDQDRLNLLVHKHNLSTVGHLAPCQDEVQLKNESIPCFQHLCNQQSYPQVTEYVHRYLGRQDGGTLLHALLNQTTRIRSNSTLMSYSTNKPFPLEFVP